tara:strand:+ start:4849 stop:5082 length:234 start_codon:yes stop_codon:yes gene_type:complete
LHQFYCEALPSLLSTKNTELIPTKASGEIRVETRSPSQNFQIKINISRKSIVRDFKQFEFVENPIKPNVNQQLWCIN